jgi:hypothetical protein
MFREVRFASYTKANDAEDDNELSVARDLCNVCSSGRTEENHALPQAGQSALWQMLKRLWTRMLDC